GGVRIRLTSAPFPKFVIRGGTVRQELRKQRGTSKYMFSSAAFDLKFPERACGRRCRDFRSAAPGTHKTGTRGREEQRKPGRTDEQSGATGGTAMWERPKLHFVMLAVLVCGAAWEARAAESTIPGTGAVVGTVTASKPFTAAQVYLRSAEKPVTFMVYTSG